MRTSPGLWGVETEAHQLAQQMARSLPVTIASVALWDQPSFALTVKAVGAPRPLPGPLPVGARIPLSMTPWHRVAFEQHEPVFLEVDGPNEVDFQREAGLCLVPNLRSIYLVPIRLGEETVGVLGLGEMRDPEREPFTEEKRQRCRAALDEFLAVSAHAWEAGRLRRQVRAMSSLVQLMGGISEARSYEDVLGCLASEVADWLGATVRGVLLQAQPRQGMAIIGRWRCPEALGLEDGQQLALALARAGGNGRWPISVANVGHDPLDPLYPATQEGETWTRIGLPLMRGDRLLGVACLYLEDDVRPAEWELEAFRRRGEIAAVGMEIVAIQQEHLREREGLGRAAYELLTTHQRTAIQEALSGVVRLVSELLPARLEQFAGGATDAALGEELAGAGLREKIAGEVTAVLQELLDSMRHPGENPPAPVEINQLVRRAVEITRSKWEEEPRRRGATVDLRFAPSTEPLVAEASVALVGALIHAIENAVEAMPEGGWIDVRTARDNGHVLISVRDTGPGVAREHRESVFAPLFSTKEKPHLGLGLSVVRAVMARHGGEVGLSGGEEGGAVFVLRLPLAAGP